MSVFFTADHHFGHKNIIEYANRPFASVQEMNETLIARWNDVVGEDDEVYHLGDVGLASSGKLRHILNQLRGNHEKSAEACHTRFEWIKDYHELILPDAETERGEQLIVLFHYALRTWNASHWGSYHLYGHSHGSLPDDSAARSFDIGVDCHDFRPLSYAQVKAIMARKEWRPPYKNQARG